jgi:methylated-DNA-[protein]-cysteine S-methyltransferase
MTRGPLSEAADQLGAYFAGSLRSFSLPLRPAGTAFFRAVWDELARVPYGGLSTYGELASRLGNPGAARAVGMALNRNPIAIIIPCHRVIGSNARLVGYAGGLDRKRFLIELESRASFGA